MADNSYLSVGLESHFVTELDKLLEDSRSLRYDFLVVPLAHPRYNRNLLDQTQSSKEPFTRSDLLFSSQQWSSMIIGKTSSWIDCDSLDDNIRRNSSAVLKQELLWASHLSLPAVVLDTPSYNSVNYGSNINQLLSNLSHVTAWIRFPLSSPQTENIEERRMKDPWEAWNRLRILTEHNVQLFPVLDVLPDLPSNDIIQRWFGEPVKAAFFSTNVFLANKYGNPTLSKRHQDLVFQLFKYKVQVVITQKKRNSNISNYAQYLRYLWKKQKKLSPEEQFEMPYLDYLQAPLQPLMDNLESQIYETFEKDPVKYVQYEKAVYLALMDRFDAKKNVTSVNDGPRERRAVVMVLGAGRGPLVRASLRAGQQANCRLLIYAVEKNPNAVVTLQNMKVELGWNDSVEVINADMRYWTSPEKADIIVSELLGSFGDNELSPECLDGGQKFLKEDGISIPSSYTSYLAPLSSQKIWNEVRSYGDVKHMETAYVVKFFNATQLAPAQECFTFDHPTPQPADNSRYTKLVFKIQNSAALHGFAGFFDATLYKQVHISINPETFSEGMFSWFPIFFPLRQPLYVPSNSSIEAHFWRSSSSNKVWYEWCVTEPTTTSIHNPNGRSYWLGL